MSDTEVEKAEVDASKDQQEAKEDSVAVPETTTEAKDEATKETQEPGDADEPAETNGEEPTKTVKAKKSTGRTPKGSKAAPKTEEDSTAEYQAGDLVQVKIQGYPWWPAMIVTPEHFPEAAMAARPQVKTRKDGTSAQTYPVQFLGSPEYYWSRPTDIKRLTQEEVKTFVDSGKKASAKGLKAAYSHAKLEPTLEQLMKAKTELEAQLARQDDDAEDDEEMPDADEEAVADESEDIELDDEGKPLKKSKSKKKSAAAAKTPKKTPSKTPTKKRKTEETEGVERSAKKPRGTPKAKQASARASPEQTPQDAHAQSVKSVMFLRHKLQKCLLGKDEPEAKLLDEIPKYLDQLDTVEANVDLFRETKIGKVLLRINKLDKIPRDETLGIKAHVGKLLEKWQEVMEMQKKKDDEESSKTAETPSKPSNGHAEDVKKDEAAKSPEVAKDAPKAVEEPAKDEAKKDETPATNGEAVKASE